MADVNKLSPFILRWEGGFVNDPDDLGGATNMGVTYKTYKSYCQKEGKPIPSIGDLKRLTKEEFTDILKTLYWDKCRADEIESQSVANAIVDFAWNSGVVTAVKHVQEVLYVQSDGIIGAVTLAAINTSDAQSLFERIKQSRVAYIESICKAREANNRFKKGWLNRINSLTFDD